MSAGPPPKYKMSFSTGGLFLNETLAVAQLHVAGEPWSVTIMRALTEGTTTLPKAASQRRTLREIVNRLSTLSDRERDYLVNDADRDDQLALLWLATCRACMSLRPRCCASGICRFIWTCHLRPSTSCLLLRPNGMTVSKGLAHPRVPSFGRFCSGLCAKRM